MKLIPHLIGTMGVILVLGGISWSQWLIWSHIEMTDGEILFTFPFQCVLSGVATFLGALITVQRISKNS